MKQDLSLSRQPLNATIGTKQTQYLIYQQGTDDWPWAIVAHFLKLLREAGWSWLAAFDPQTSELAYIICRRYRLQTKACVSGAPHPCA